MGKTIVKIGNESRCLLYPRHNEPTTDPAPLIRNADASPAFQSVPRIPRESHDASTTTEFGRSVGVRHRGDMRFAPDPRRAVMRASGLEHPSNVRNSEIPQRLHSTKNSRFGNGTEYAAAGIEPFRESSPVAEKSSTVPMQRR
jgi:hypothetical protein